MRQAIGVEMRQSYPLPADPGTSITSTVPPTVDERLVRVESGLSQSISLKSEIFRLEKRLNKQSEDQTALTQSLQSDLARCIAEKEKTDQAGRRTDKNFKAVEVALNRSRDGITQLTEVTTKLGEELESVKRWAKASFGEMGGALSRDFSALFEAVEGAKAKVVELGAKVENGLSGAKESAGSMEGVSVVVGDENPAQIATSATLHSLERLETKLEDN